MTGPKSDHSIRGIGFLGEITAAISHELKNSLAIINENAGLLGDLSAMAANGNSLDPKRLEMVASRIQRQVRRADDLIKRLNQVSDSVKRFRDEVNVVECIEIVRTLVDRKALLKAVTLRVVLPPKPVMVNTNPFGLQQLVWLCLDQAIAVADASDTVAVTIKSEERGATIIFSLMDETGNKPVDIGLRAFPHKLTKILNADLVSQRNRGILVISLPFKMSMRHRSEETDVQKNTNCG